MLSEELSWDPKMQTPPAYSEMLRNSLLRSEEKIEELEHRLEELVRENEQLRLERNAALFRLEAALEAVEKLAFVARKVTGQ